MHSEKSVEPGKKGTKVQQRKLHRSIQSEDHFARHNSDTFNFFINLTLIC